MDVQARLDKVLGKVEKNSDVIAMLAGFLAAPMGTGLGFGAVPGYVWDKIVNWRFPDKATLDGIKAYLTDKTSPAYAPFVYGIVAGLAAQFGKEFDADKLHPIIAKAMGLAESIGWPMAVYTALSSLVYVPSTAHMSHPTIKELITGKEAPESVQQVAAQYATLRGCY